MADRHPEVSSSSAGLPGLRIDQVKSHARLPSPRDRDRRISRAVGLFSVASAAGGGLGDWRSVLPHLMFFKVMTSAVGAVARWISPVLAVATVVGVGLSVDPTPVSPAPAVRLASDGNPLTGPLYVNPNSAAVRASQADP